FRVTQVQTAISKSLPEPSATSAALESAQVVALGILVGEQMEPAQFEAVYRPFAKILPGPTYRAPAPIDQQIAVFLRRLPGLKGEVEAEVSTVAKALSQPPKPASPAGAGGVPVIAAVTGLDPTVNYTAAWKEVISTASQVGRTQAIRGMQEGGEHMSPDDMMWALADAYFPPQSRAAPRTRRDLGGSDPGGLLQAELLDRGLAHLELLDLPRDRHRECVHELPVARDLVGRDLALAPCGQLFAG